MSQLRSTVRALLRDKGFSITVLMTLAICVMANTTTFAIVNCVLLRPLPLPEADNIVLIANRYPKAVAEITNQSSYGDYTDRLKGVPALERLAMFQYRDQTLDINGNPEQVAGMLVTASFFDVARVRPSFGRSFETAEEEPGKDDKVILSSGLAKQLFGAESAASGQTLRISGRTHSVVGVMPASFSFPGKEARLWIALAVSSEVKQRYHSNNWYQIGRLRPGATIAQVQAQVDAINAGNLDRFPQFRQLLINAGFHSVVEPLKVMLVRQIESSLYLLWGGALCVLLIGALNLANLSLARFSARTRDIATRLAIGASSAQVWRGVVIEHVAVALAGGVLGLIAGSVLLRILASAAAITSFPRASEVHIDAVTVVVALLLSALTGLAMALAPVTGVLRVRVSGMLRESGERSGTAGRRAQAFRRMLVVAEIGFAFVLLLGAGLLLTSFRNLLKADPGFRADHVLTAFVNAPRTRYKSDDDLRRFTTAALEAVRRIPGVTTAGVTDTIPLGGNTSDSVVFAEGYQMRPGESVISPLYMSVTPGYFEAMRIPLLRGRYFTEHDTETSLPVVLVDEQLANRFWPNQDPIGRRMYQPTNANDLMRITEKTKFLTVVGVVRTIRVDNLAGMRDSVGAYYFPLTQQPSRMLTFAVLTDAAVNQVVNALRSEVHRLDPEMAVSDVKTMNERTDLALAAKRIAMLLATGFGGIALLLSAVGIYGVLAYTVVQRTREIGIRVALGSTGTGIIGLILRDGLAMLSVGILFGCAGALALQSVLAREVYGVKPLDPLMLTTVSAVLMLIALLACMLPARRAARLDVVTVLNG